ncbi:MAG: peptide chain release factor 2 [Capsulimonadaceae bacterium]
MFDDAVKTSIQIRSRFDRLSGPLDLDGKRGEISDLEAEAGRSDFWDDPSSAQAQMQRLNVLKESISPWTAVRRRLDDIATMIELAQNEDDPEPYSADIEGEIRELTQILDHLEIRTLLSGPHDAAPALLEINAGAGGDEANDWAAMLLRMYLRWADRNGYKAEIVDEVEGDVAGIKSSTVRFEGKSAYGLLQGERGVHRLVRLSPFNANNKRQTSFASVDIVPEVEEVADVEIPDKDLRRDTYRSSGAGGQHVNKTSSAVRLTHLPTGIVVSCQNERSQMQNEAFAMKVLKSKLLELARQENKASIDELRGERKGIEFGSQIRSYVFQPYTLVKDLRTGHETGDIIRVMDGEFNDFMDAYLRWQHEQRNRTED